MSKTDAPDKKCQLNGEPDCKPECTKDLCDHFLTDAEATPEADQLKRDITPTVHALGKVMLEAKLHDALEFLKEADSLIEDIDSTFNPVKTKIWRDEYLERLETFLKGAE